MLVLSPNTKRQRRPNVRLGEIGEVAASVPCKNFLKTKLKAEEKRLEGEPDKPDDWNYCVSPRASVETQNWENWNPNSKKYNLEAEGDDTRKPRMGFGLVNRKGRFKKQRKWSMRSSGVTGSGWHSRVSAEISNRSENEVYGCDNSSDHSFNTGQEGFKEHLDHGTWDKIYDCQERNSNDSLSGDVWEEASDRTGIIRKLKAGSTLVNGVREWLVELGFGKYAGLFEMHEVDEETLPSLTYEDLKEMGIFTVGVRRRMYTAIQVLNKGSDV